MNDLIRSVGLDNLLVLGLTAALLLCGAVAVMLWPRAFWRRWESLVGQQEAAVRRVAVTKDCVRQAPTRTPQEEKALRKKNKRRDKARHWAQAK